MSLRTAKSGLGVNSIVVPTASPTASPTSAPIARSLIASASLAGIEASSLLPCLTQFSCSGVSIAPARTARTSRIAASGSTPLSTSSRAAIIPGAPETAPAVDEHVRTAIDERLEARSVGQP
jgi:hypothetical protein